MDNKYDVIIIGGGPAGLSAALYTSRANLKVLVIEKNVIASQLYETEHIDNYLGSVSINASELADKMREDGAKFGAELKEFENVTKISKENNLYKVEITETYDESVQNIYYAKAVLLATGTEHNHLILEQHDELLGMGISYCATCDGAFYAGKNTAVVGGGDSAMESALLLSEFANKVYLLIRDKIRAKSHLLKMVEETENIEIIYNEVKELISKDGALNAVKLKDDTKVKQFFESLNVAIFAASLGGAETLVTHPSTITHAEMPDEEKEARGFTNSLIRIAVGFENIDDLIADFDNALK